MALITDSIAYNKTPVWNKNAVSVAGKATVDSMLKAAGLDWEVEKRPVFDQDGKTIPGQFALTRADNGEFLNMCGSRYKPVQNRDSFGFFNEYLKEGKAELDVMGSLDRNRVVWGLAKLNTSFKVGTRDNVEGYIFVGSPHGAGRSFQISLTTLREVCNNTIAVTMRDSSKRAGLPAFTMRHSATFDEAAISSARHALDGAREEFQLFGKLANKLSKSKISDLDAWNVFAKTFSPKEKNEFDPDAAGKVMKEIWGAYLHAPGASTGNAWGVLNAVTHYTDHTATKNADRRLTAAFIGKNATNKASTLKTLEEMFS